MFCEASDRLIGKASDPRYEGGDSNVMKKIKRNEKKYQYGTILLRILTGNRTQYFYTLESLEQIALLLS